MVGDGNGLNGMDFAELGLGENVLKAIDELGYTEPTPIQVAAIPAALEGRDVLGVAQTGTGKTASFTLPLIEHLSRGRAKARMPRSIILTPTRELADQIAENFDKYGQYQRLSKALLIGGVSLPAQERQLTGGVDVLIATPGRLLDLFNRGAILMTGVQIMVVDEADRMLDMGFIDDIKEIFRKTPFTRQTLFFSATMPPAIEAFTKEFLQNPVRIEVARQSTTAETITQWVVRASDGAPKTKRAALRAAIDAAALKNAIIFCNRKRDVDVVARSLQRHGFAAAAIHGDLAQSVRMATLDRFKSGEITLLVASDVAARGLDIPDVSHVFNYDVPRHAEDYVHRIGRTGRAGKTGEAFTIATPEDSKTLKAVESLIKRTIPVAEHAQTPKPDGAEPQTTPKSATPKSSAPAGGSEDRPDAPRSTAHDEATTRRRGSAGRKSSSGRRGERGKPRELEEAVVGLGDHTPAFLLRSVD